MLVKKDCKISNGILFRRYVTSKITNPCDLCGFSGDLVCPFIIYSGLSRSSKKCCFTCIRDRYTFLPIKRC